MVAPPPGEGQVTADQSERVANSEAAAARSAATAVPDQPTELDQVGVLIVEEQLGLTTTDLDGLRAFARELPFEPSMSLLALLAGRVEAALSSPTRQLKLAESFFGRNELTSSYAALVRNDPKAYVFGPQSLYTLMRVLIEEAYDAPIDQALTTEEKVTLMRAVIASNSVAERGTDTGVGPTSEYLLAYELQVRHYYSRARVDGGDDPCS